MFKKQVRFLVVMLLAFGLVLAGCGGSDQQGSPSTSQPSGGDKAPAKVEENKGKVVELTMYSWRPEDREAYEKFIAAFEAENPNIKVSFKPFKSTEYNTILNNTLQSKTGADIIQLRPYSGATSIADGGFLVALDDVPGVKDIPEVYLDAAKGSDGKVYGVPLSLNAGVIFYNPNLFKEHNLEVPETWDEFLAVAEALKSKGITPIAQAGKAAYLLSMTHGVIGTTAYGGNQFIEDFFSGKADFKDPRFMESIERMNILRDYFPKDFIGIDDSDAQGMFLTGKAAMYINGNYRLETFEKNAPDFELDILPTFAATKGGDRPLTTWVDGSYAVVEASKHKEEALKFMEFLASKQFGEMFSDELNRMSAVQGIEPKHPLVKKMTQMSEESNTPYMMLVNFGEGTPTTKTTFENALQGLYIDQITMEDVANETQESADKWVEIK